MFNESFEEVQSCVTTLEKERTYYKQSFENLENRLQDIEFRSRSAGVEIRNVHLKESESAKDLTNIAVQVGSKIKMDLHSNEIRNIYRMPGKSNTSRPIIVEFSFVPVKTSVIDLVRSYNKNSNKGNKLNFSQRGLKCENRRRRILSCCYKEHILHSEMFCCRIKIQILMVYKELNIFA